MGLLPISHQIISSSSFSLLDFTTFPLYGRLPQRLELPSSRRTILKVGYSCLPAPYNSTSIISLNGQTHCRRSSCVRRHILNISVLWWIVWIWCWKRYVLFPISMFMSNLTAASRKRFLSRIHAYHSSMYALSLPPFYEFRSYYLT